ncbi:MAG TPA: ABC transporter permease [Candidatus Eisenbacteria bacterium]|nr:ABC transporter permease [Candidatus Eisenbacteria bacterium]
MIATLLRLYALNLRRDRVAQMMAFLLPVVFFSIFALVFGGRRDATAKIPVAIADEDHSPTSRRLIAALAAEPGLAVHTTAREPGAPRAPETALTRARATQQVHDGTWSVALVLPAGLDTSIARFDDRGGRVELLADPSDPVAPPTVAGLLQKVAITVMPERYAASGLRQFERYAGGLTPRQRAAVRPWLDRVAADTGAVAPAGAGGDTSGFQGLVRVHRTDVVGATRDNGMVSFYAAAIAVMFLLFTSSASAGALLDEVEAGTLERVISTRAGMTGLLAGKYLSIALLGVLQIVVMFAWAKLAFHLGLAGHLAGFAVMTVVTAATAAAFGLVLATLCRTRAQLSGVATVVILVMSALGGSMFPRFLMSETLQRAGLLTFNAWALDGFVKVFWRNASVAELGPQVGVLLACLGAFLILARLLARRWEAA